MLILNFDLSSRWKQKGGSLYEVRGGILLIIGVEWYTDSIREKIYFQNIFVKCVQITAICTASIYIIYNRTDTIAVITALRIIW